MMGLCGSLVVDRCTTRWRTNMKRWLAALGSGTDVSAADNNRFTPPHTVVRNAQGQEGHRHRNPMVPSPQGSRWQREGR